MHSIFFFPMISRYSLCHSLLIYHHVGIFQDDIDNLAENDKDDIKKLSKPGWNSLFLFKSDNHSYILWCLVLQSVALYIWLSHDLWPRSFEIIKRIWLRGDFSFNKKRVGTRFGSTTEQDIRRIHKNWHRYLDTSWSAREL